MQNPLLLLLLVASLTGATSSTAAVRDDSDDYQYLDDYFRKVTADFNRKILEQGISMLPVNDVSLDINRTVGFVPVVGTVIYRNGLVSDVGDFLLKKEGHRGTPEDDGAHLFYQINFPNLTIVADVEADLQPLGKDKGTAELIFENTTIAVYFDKNYTLGTTSVLSKPYATMGPSTAFLPVSDVMDAAARLARLELGYRLLWDQLDEWCNATFNGLLTTIIKENEFPLFPPLL